MVLTPMRSRRPATPSCPPPPETSLFDLLTAHHRRVLQAGQTAQASLSRVLVHQQHVLGPPAFSALRWLNDSNSTSRRRSTLSDAGRIVSRRNSRCRTVFSGPSCRDCPPQTPSRPPSTPPDSISSSRAVSPACRSRRRGRNRYRVVAWILEVVGVAAEEAMSCSGAKTSRTSVYFL